jgi:hypothetical protein
MQGMIPCIILSTHFTIKRQPYTQIRCESVVGDTFEVIFELFISIEQLA